MTEENHPTLERFLARADEIKGLHRLLLTEEDVMQRRAFAEEDGETYDELESAASDLDTKLALGLIATALDEVPSLFDGTLTERLICSKLTGQKSQSSSEVASALPITYELPLPEKKSWFSSAFGDSAERMAGFTFVTDAGNIAS